MPVDDAIVWLRSFNVLAPTGEQQAFLAHVHAACSTSSVLSSGATA